VTASPPDPKYGRAKRLGAPALLCCLLAAACTRPAPTLRHQILSTLAPKRALQPSDADFASRDLIRASLISDLDQVDRSLETVLEIDSRDLPGDDPDLDRRIPMSIDLANATLDDPEAYREACRSLSKRRDLDPRLKERLEECEADDLLKLANRRVWDRRETLFAYTYNAVAEPLGRSLLSGGVLSPYYIATSVAEYMALINELDPFPVQLRQALVHRENFLRRFPDDEEAPKVRRQVEKARRKLHKEQSKKLTFAAKRALRSGRTRYAHVLAEEAASRNPENKKAVRLMESTQAILQEERALRLMSERVAGPSNEIIPPGAEELTAALLDPDADIAEAARALLRSRPDPAQREIAKYVLATSMHEAGLESAGWRQITDLSVLGPLHSRMARHAGALYRDPLQNTYGSFLASRRNQTTAEVKWRILGPWAGGPRYRRLPQPIAWILDLPSIANTAATSPIRLVLSPMSQKPDFQQATAVAGYRYLEHNPSGEHMNNVAGWLYGYEKKQKNWSGALRLADLLTSVPQDDRTELFEKAAAQQVAAAERAPRRSLKNSLLRHAAREYPDSSAGHAAGVAVRRQLENASEQKIRMTKGFLQENPRIAGPAALGIRPELLDDRNTNGELHPLGVTFVNGRAMEFEFLNESGDKDDPPVKVRRPISKERMASVVAALDDSVYGNMRVDPDDVVRPDASRDLFFERARLGLADQPDLRSAAHSTYVFESTRERFGVVRGRESILPFEIVVQGDLTKLGIAAFPRWRIPKETPDAFLFR